MLLVFDSPTLTYPTVFPETVKLMVFVEAFKTHDTRNVPSVFVYEEMTSFPRTDPTAAHGVTRKAAVKTESTKTRTEAIDSKLLESFE